MRTSSIRIELLKAKEAFLEGKAFYDALIQGAYYALKQPEDNWMLGRIFVHMDKTAMLWTRFCTEATVENKLKLLDDLLHDVKEEEEKT